MQLAAAPNNSSISSLVGPLSKDRPAHDALHVPMTDLVNAGPPCRLVAKHLILHSRNIARRVDTGLEIIELWPAFQSEKTGSTPVGSANLFNHFQLLQCSTQDPLQAMCKQAAPGCVEGSPLRSDVREGHLIVKPTVVVAACTGR
jgi:hypothetical protein